jgi:hypothetical protein
MIVNILQNLGYGLTIYLAEQDVGLYQKGGVWFAEGSENAQLLIDNYNPWPYEKAAKFSEIDTDFETAVAALTAGWPVHEMQTWSKQEAEARAFTADPLAATPMLSAIASTRGLTVAQLAERVIRDADAFTAASAYYVGLRHKTRQLVQALPDEGSLERLPELFAIKFGD